VGLIQISEILDLLNDCRLFIKESVRRGGNGMKSTAEEIVMAYFKSLFRHLPGGTKEIHEKSIRIFSDTVQV
jgi:hypothetical protein